MCNCREEKRRKVVEALVVALPPVPAIDLDADISPEEMQMMQAMGIPTGFDTTHVRLKSG